MENQLIIFIKNPVKGIVKTRLAKGSDDDYALEVYNYLLGRTKAVTQNLNVNKILYYSHFLDEFDKWPHNIYKKHLQCEGDLGLRMTAAFQLSLMEHKKVVIIGSDCPDLTEAIIEDAFLKLSSFDSVIGPSPDGGYYLLGMKDFHPFLFTDIDWSTEKVLEQTLRKISDHNLSFHLLPILNDIDTMEDWVEYLQNLK